MKTYRWKSIAKGFAGLVFGVVTVWNFWEVNVYLNEPPYREFTEVADFENRFLQIKFELWREGSRSGNLAYATTRSFRGLPPTEKDGIHWAQLRYVTVPFNLVQDLSGATYVLGDFTEDGGVPETPPGFTKLLDGGSGLVLYRRETTP